MEPNIHALGMFWLHLFFVTPSDFILSVCISVWFCLWPISLILCCMYTDYLTLMNGEPSSANAADDMIALMICKIISTAPLFLGNG